MNHDDEMYTRICKECEKIFTSDYPDKYCVECVVCYKEKKRTN